MASETGPDEPSRAPPTIPVGRAAQHAPQPRREAQLAGRRGEISSAITAELRTIVDYHNCRVYLLQPDGVTLYPVAFRGEMFSGYEKDTSRS